MYKSWNPHDFWKDPHLVQGLGVVEKKDPRNMWGLGSLSQTVHLLKCHDPVGVPLLDDYPHGRMISQFGMIPCTCFDSFLSDVTVPDGQAANQHFTHLPKGFSYLKPQREYESVFHP